MPDYITLEPDYPNLARWWGTVFAQHGFERFATGPVHSFIEIIAYLAVTQPDEIALLLKYFPDYDYTTKQNGND